MPGKRSARITLCRNRLLASPDDRCRKAEANSSGQVGLAVRANEAPAPRAADAWPGARLSLLLPRERDADHITVEHQLRADKTLNIKNGLPAVQLGDFADQQQPIAWPNLAPETNLFQTPEADEISPRVP